MDPDFKESVEPKKPNITGLSKSEVTESNKTKPAELKKSTTIKYKKHFKIKTKKHHHSIKLALEIKKTKLPEKQKKAKKNYKYLQFLKKGGAKK